MQIHALSILLISTLASTAAIAKDSPSSLHGVATDEVITQQHSLEQNTNGKGFGPQSPRDIDLRTGSNSRIFSPAPDYTQMNLCNIHFHKNAEHKGGEFTKHAGHGPQAGFLFSGELSAAEAAPVSQAICPSKQGGLQAGDTIEAHYVFSTAQVEPGPTLGACLSDSISNPQLRVEAQTYVLVNDETALDFTELSEVGVTNGLHQALNIPTDTGVPVEYAGSTTGPAYNKQGSPFQVSWRVRPNIAKVDIKTVGKWCEGNIFKEDHAHGVRELVVDPKLLSDIK